jgi:hypothetical protein
MHITNIKTTLISAAITLSLAVPGAAMAYGKNDAIKDCKQRLRDEYKLTDFRHESAQELPGQGHKYKVTGNTKVDNDKYDFSCEIKDRHVTSINYDGPKPKGMTGAQKLAVGAAAVAAAGVIASKMKEQGEDTGADTDVGKKTGITWFYPMAGTDNYYSPRKGQSNLILSKSGKNYWFKNDDGKVVWLYPQGDRFYSPRPDGKKVWCYRSGKNIYCQG